jgi:hypothetical protein
LEVTPFQVRLIEAETKTPSRIAIQLPRETAQWLILHRLAVPVADQANVPDFVMDEDEANEVWRWTDTLVNSLPSRPAPALSA